MSRMQPLGAITIQAGSTDLPRGRAVRFDGTDWELCAAGEVPDAITDEPIVAGQFGRAFPIKALTSHIVQVSGTPAAGANLYVTTAGVFTSTASGNGNIRGKMYKTAAAANNEFVEAFLYHTT